VAQCASFNQPHREDNMSSSWPVCQTPEILALIFGSGDPRSVDPIRILVRTKSELAERLRF
jgi:hypothetical protein